MPLHIFGSAGDYEVWLDTEVQHRDGICVGCGTTRESALTDAINELNEALVEAWIARRSPESDA